MVTTYLGRVHLFEASLCATQIGLSHTSLVGSSSVGHDSVLESSIRPTGCTRCESCGSPLYTASRPSGDDSYRSEPIRDMIYIPAVVKKAVLGKKGYFAVVIGTTW